MDPRLRGDDDLIWCFAHFLRLRAKHHTPLPPYLLHRCTSCRIGRKRKEVVRSRTPVRAAVRSVRPDTWARQQCRQL